MTKGLKVIIFAEDSIITPVLLKQGMADKGDGILNLTASQELKAKGISQYAADFGLLQ
jgi:hypothetical protein